MSHTFKLLDKLGVPSENPFMKTVNLRTEKIRDQDLNLESSCCKATVLTAAQPCSQ